MWDSTPGVTASVKRKEGAQENPVGAPLSQHVFLLLLRVPALLRLGQLNLLPEVPDSDPQADWSR